jgi:proteasome lid subunit RPN8/RPN11
MAKGSELYIPKEMFSQMVSHARKEAPIEACGILAGRDKVTERYYRMQNTDHSEEHFLMDPNEQYKIIMDIRNSGFQMLAVYHSHPKTPARPSKEDIRMALTPDVIYLIISLADAHNPAIRGFLIDDSNVTEVPVKIRD